MLYLIYALSRIVILKRIMGRHNKIHLALFFAAVISALSHAIGADELPLVDAHIHYSHDAWQVLSPERAVELLRAAGLKKALVSSSSDEGTQKLYRIAPDLVVPVLRPYRKRGELSSWIYDESVKSMLSAKLAQGVYAGIGEFHADGEQSELPVMQHVIALANKGYQQALKDDRWLRDGLNVHAGKVTQQQVAHDLGYDFHDPDSLLS